MQFDENKHPRDNDGKFTDGEGETDKLAEATRIYSDDPSRDLAESGYNELNALLGQEFKGYKGQDAIDKLLQERRGHIKGAFHRDDIGDIDIFWGNENVGLRHIIRQRLKEKAYSREQIDRVKDVLSHIEVTIKNGVLRKENKRGDKEFIYQGYGVAIAPAYHGNKITYLLTAYKNEKSKKK